MTHSRSWDMEIMTTLGWKCHTRAQPECDIFNLGLSYLNVALTTVHHLYIMSFVIQSGSFVVRSSRTAGPNKPYVMTILCRNEIFHVPIRRRTRDSYYAVGEEKPDELVCYVPPATHDTIRYDTRWYFNVCSKATWVSVLYRTEPTTKKSVKTEKKLLGKNGYAQK